MMMTDKSSQRNLCFWVAIQCILMVSIKNPYAQSLVSSISTAPLIISSSPRISSSCGQSTRPCRLIGAYATRNSAFMREEKIRPSTSLRISHSTGGPMVSLQENPNPLMSKTSWLSQYLGTSPSCALSPTSLMPLKSTTPSPVIEKILNSPITTYINNSNLRFHQPIHKNITFQRLSLRLPIQVYLYRVHTVHLI